MSAGESTAVRISSHSNQHGFTLVSRSSKPAVQRALFTVSQRRSRPKVVADYMDALQVCFSPVDMVEDTPPLRGMAGIADAPIGRGRRRDASKAMTERDQQKKLP